jgi:transposase
MRLLAAIDVSATELVVALRFEGASAPPPKTTAYPNTAPGHRQLIKALTAGGATARVILEATGVYSLGLALALDRAAGVEVMVIN